MARPVDGKREEFRKYLERTGVIDALTKVLVSLYEEESKPDDALSYILKNLCDSSAVKAEVDGLKAQLEESAAKNKELKVEIAKLKGEEPPADEPAPAEPAEAPAEPPADAEAPAEPPADAPPEEAPAAEEPPAE